MIEIAEIAPLLNESASVVYVYVTAVDEKLSLNRSAVRRKFRTVESMLSGPLLKSVVSVL